MTDRGYTIKETARVSRLMEDTLRYYERAAAETGVVKVFSGRPPS